LGHYSRTIFLIFHFNNTKLIDQFYNTKHVVSRLLKANI